MTNYGPALAKGPMTERQWELYRRGVLEGMPDSDYKTAVLAGIAHTLIEAPLDRSRSIPPGRLTRSSCFYGARLQEIVVLV